MLQIRINETEEIQLASQRSAKEEAVRVAALESPKFVKASGMHVKHCRCLLQLLSYISFT